MNRTTTRQALVGILAAGLAASAFTTMPAAHALDETEALARIQQIEKGATELSSVPITRAELRAAAKKANLSVPKYARRVLKEAQPVVRPAGSPLARAASSGGGDGTVPFPKAKRKGDIFVHSSTSKGFNHGHAGLYGKRTTVIEAPGGDAKSREVAISKRKGPKNEFFLYRVGESKKRRLAAIKQARTYYIGKPYDSNFFRNRKNGSKKLNCSELVWRAFKYNTYSKIDVDDDKGWGVYPRDIQDSGWTHYYGGV